jgi:hypothetical protein
VTDVLEEFDNQYQNGFIKNIQNRNRLNEVLSNDVLMKSYGIKDPEEISEIKAEFLNIMDTATTISNTSHNSTKTISTEFMRTAIQ